MRFGRVLAGEMNASTATNFITTYHTFLLSRDDVLIQRKFWKIEEKDMNDSALSLEERTVVHHFQDHVFSSAILKEKILL